MAVNINIPEKRHHGGGGFLGALGSIGGAILGAVAAPFTGGSSLAAAGLGSSLGGAAGGMADAATSPGETRAQGGLGHLQAMKVDPNVQLAAIENARQQIPQAGLNAPDANAILDHLNKAKTALNGMNNPGGMA